MKLAVPVTLPSTSAAAAAVPGAIPAARFARLAPLAPVGLHVAACLALHKSWVACRACQAACPRGCLTVDGAALALEAAACVGCGRCAVACPTGALAVDGFNLREIVAGQALDLACHRQQAVPDGAIRVPCLGGLSAGDLLALLRRTGGAPVGLVDDGSCEACPTCLSAASVSDRSDRSEYDVNTPPQQLLAAVAPLLQAARLPADRVAIVPSCQLPPSRPLRSPLPFGNRPAPAVRSASAEPPLAARRAFFSGLGRVVSAGIVRQAGAASPLADLERLPSQPRQLVPYRRGQETRLLLLHFASQAGQLPAAARLARVTASDRCRGHGSCAQLCPTGALHVEMQEGVRRLIFDPWQCVACGSCASACPERALHYEAPAWGAFASGSVVLARREQQACRRCGDLFAAADGGDLCAVCAKSESLAQAGLALFAGLRGGKRNDSNATGPPG